MTGGFSPFPVDEEGDAHSNGHFQGTARVKGPTWLQLPALTIGLLGVQIMWSVEMSYASPYLLSLGLSKSWMAMVFVAGPLSGLIMQPLIGVLADNSKSRFGRRRPYMIAGSLLCSFAIILLGFTRSFSSIFTTEGSHSNDILTIWLAVLAIYLIDFTINAVQAVDRALLVDTLPTSQQPSVNAWAARMLGIGSVLGFFLGAVDLKALFSFFGNTELKILSVLSVFLLIATHAITSGSVEERVLVSSRLEKKSFIQEVRSIIAEIMTLPRDIRQICVIQFFAWIGWFPVIFYTTTYIGDIHKANSPLTSSADADSSALLALSEEGTRLGTRAMLCSSILSLASNILLPFLTAGSSDAKPRSRGKKRPWWNFHLASLWAASHLIFACCMGATLFSSSVTGSTILITITGFSWAITQWAPFSLLAEAILTAPPPGAEDGHSIMLGDARTSRTSLGLSEEERGLLPPTVRRRSQEDIRSRAEEDDDPGRASFDDESGPPNADANGHLGFVLGNKHARRSTLDVDISNESSFDEEEDEDGPGVSRTKGSGLSAKAGIILGIHNIFVVIPQFLVTGLSSAIFALVDPGKSVLHGTHPGNISSNSTAPVEHHLAAREGEGGSMGPNAVGIVFRIGGISAFVAFVLCWRLARELKKR